MNENVVSLAASALTSWKNYDGKHSLDSSNSNSHEDDDANIPLKRARVEQHQTTMTTMIVPTAQVAVVEGVAALSKPQLKPYPYFYYTDYSQCPDEDPYTPLTFPGRVPNFPAKLHAILSRSDLSDIIDWVSLSYTWRWVN